MLKQTLPAKHRNQHAVQKRLKEQWKKLEKNKEVIERRKVLERAKEGDECGAEVLEFGGKD